MKTFKFPMGLNNAELMNTDLRNTRLEDGDVRRLQEAGYVTVGDLVNDINSDNDINVRWVGSVRKFNIMRELFRLTWDSLKEDERVDYIVRLAKENGADPMRIVEALLKEGT